jgi:hypothetical protein
MAFRGFGGLDLHAALLPCGSFGYLDEKVSLILACHVDLSVGC